MAQKSNLVKLQELLDWNNIKHEESENKNEILIKIFSPLSARIEILFDRDSAYAPARNEKNSSNHKANHKAIEDQNAFLIDFYKLRSEISLQDSILEYDDNEIRDRVKNDWRESDSVRLVESDHDDYLDPKAVMIQEVFGNREDNMDLIVMLAKSNMRFFRNVMDLIDKYFYIMDREEFDADDVRLNSYRDVLLENFPKFKDDEDLFPDSM